jgi:hypothetical protein
MRGLTRVSKRDEGIVVKFSFSKAPKFQIIARDPAFLDARIKSAHDAPIDFPEFASESAPCM